MLHDLYLLSCYFDPSQAMMYEDDLRRKYGAQAVQDALREGFLDIICAPCAKRPERLLCRISAAGIGRVEQALT